MKAILYTSKTGHSKRYAELLSARIGVPAYNLASAGADVPAGSDIIYIGWLCKGKIQGYSKVKNKYNVKAICPVGMWPAYLHEKYKVASKNKTGSTPIFYLQGGLETAKLRGWHLILMIWMTNALIKRLQVIETRSEMEEELLVMTRDGKSYVSDENLNWVVEWYNNEYQSAE